MTSADSWDIKILSQDQMAEVQNTFVLLGITKKYKAKLTYFYLVETPSDELLSIQHTFAIT